MSAHQSQPVFPPTDPTPIFELFRGGYGTELLVASSAHFNVFGRLANEPQTETALGLALGLERRPSVVLFTALRAMKLLRVNAAGKLELTDLARNHLLPDGAFFMGDYLGLASASPGVVNMVKLLRSNRPLGSDNDDGVAFIYREGKRSAMESEELARHFTLSLCGRAKNVAPYLAKVVPMGGVTTLLDVGGGTGLYSYSLLQANPTLRAVIVELPEVVRIAEEFAREKGLLDRVEIIEGDMFRIDDLPAAQMVLFSNILHDWDEPECRELTARYAAKLPSGGRMLIHDVFLNDTMDGPLPIALYSSALFSVTEGRAYSAAEYRAMLNAAGLITDGQIVNTLVHCAVLTGTKP